MSSLSSAGGRPESDAADVPEVVLPADGDAEREHCWNLFVLRNRPEATGLTREEMIAALKAENVGTGVHWQGLFGFSFYRDYFAWAAQGREQPIAQRALAWLEANRPSGHRRRFPVQIWFPGH